VVGVTDGDTISVMREGQAVKVRLAGIDCPEIGQPYGKRAIANTDTARSVCQTKSVFSHSRVIDVTSLRFCTCPDNIANRISVKISELQFFNFCG